MMEIEQNWNDITVYFVEFTALGKNGINRDYRRMLAFNSGCSESEIVVLIKKYFSSSIVIKAVSEFENGIMLKSK